MLNSLDPDWPSTEEKWAACGADMLVGMLTKDLQQLKPYCKKYVEGKSSKMYCGNVFYCAMFSGMKNILLFVVVLWF